MYKMKRAFRGKYAKEELDSNRETYGVKKLSVKDSET
jgi:hypothetical protein